MSKPVARMHNIVRVNPYTRCVTEGTNPGAQVRVSRALVFVPFEQLRSVADQLHDLADRYEAQGYEAPE